MTEKFYRTEGQYGSTKENGRAKVSWEKQLGFQEFWCLIECIYRRGKLINTGTIYFSRWRPVLAVVIYFSHYFLFDFVFYLLENIWLFWRGAVMSNGDSYAPLWWFLVNLCWSISHTHISLSRSLSILFILFLLFGFCIFQILIFLGIIYFEVFLVFNFDIEASQLKFNEGTKWWGFDETLPWCGPYNYFSFWG